MHSITSRFIDRLTTKKGMYTTIILWFAAAVLLFAFAPSAHHHSDEHSLETIPASSPSVIAQDEIATYFPDEAGFTGRLVFESKQVISNENFAEVIQLIQADKNMVLTETDEIKVSDDQQAAYMPVTFEKQMTAKHLKAILAKIQDASDQSGMKVYLTGPAGDALNNAVLFSNIDMGVLFYAGGILLVLLLFIFRPAYFAIIPLGAAAVTYVITERLLGLFHLSGIVFTNTSPLLMGVLLFFLINFYTLILFSKYRQAIQHPDEPSTALAAALKQLSLCLYYSGIILFAMAAILYTAYYNDYRNLAFVLGITVAVAYLAAFTLIPALMLLIPAHTINRSKARKPVRLWKRLGETATAKPIHTALAAGLSLILLSIIGLGLGGGVHQQPQNLDGQSVLEHAFTEETFATERVLLTSSSAITEKESEDFIQALENINHLVTVTLDKKSTDNKALLLEVAIDSDPTTKAAMDSIDNVMKQEKGIIAKTGVHGELFIAGETARTLDLHNILIRDTIVLIITEIVLMFSLLILFTRSAILAGILLGINLLTITTALSLGSMLATLGLNIAPTVDTVLYLFIFLLCFGIAQVFYFMFHYAEAKRQASVPAAVKGTVIETGGTVFSISVLLMIGFAACLFWPNRMIASFSFIALICMLIYVFVIHSLLLPSLLVMTEKNEHLRIIRRKRKKTGVMR